MKFSTVLKLTLALSLTARVALAQVPLEGRPIVAVHVSGLDHIKEDVVLTQMESATGRPYRQAIADRDVVRLDRLGVFGAISVAAVEVAGGVRLDVDVRETPRIVPALALAVTDENGTSAGPSVRFTNLAGHPIDVSMSALFGGETRAVFRETWPQLTNRRLWHSARLSLGDHYNGLEQFTERAVDLDVRAGARLSEQWLAGGIVQFYGVRSDLNDITLSPSNHDTFTSIGGVTEFDNRDSWRDPTRGWFGSIDSFWRTGSGQYTTLDVDVRRYQPVAPRHTILATALVTLQTGIEGVDVPTYADYAIGGENTVRGQSFGTSRGKNQFISTVEYRFMALPTRSFRVFGLNLYGGLALAAFTDVGSAWNDSTEFSDGVITGGGIGLRLYIPYVNMIRLDLSVGNGLHAGLGINEKAVAQRNRVR